MANIEGQGINQDDLVTFLTLMNTQLSAMLVKLAADTGLDAGTDYTDLTLTFPSTTISAGGIRSQGDILTFLQNWITVFNAVLAMIDADVGVTAVNWVSTWAITTPIDSVTAGNLYQTGMNQSQLVNLLQTCITNFAGLTAKLDADGDINTATYTNDNITDTIITVGCND